jgi:beta-1,4-N-acetylglucosaminyltransferase
LKICIVSSCGGHLTEVRCLKSAYNSYEHFYVLNERVALLADMKDRTYFITHSERDWKFFLNLWEAFKILRIEKPNAILSTGAGPAVPFAIVARYWFGMRVIFVETITRMEKPSVSGRIMYLLAHDFYYQWRSLERFFPKGTYGGTVL